MIETYTNGRKWTRHGYHYYGGFRFFPYHAIYRIIEECECGLVGKLESGRVWISSGPRDSNGNPKSEREITGCAPAMIGME